MIKARAIVTTRRQPARKPVRLPPTQSVLSITAYRLADELGGRDLSEADRDAAATEIYSYAEKSVSTSWSLVDAADMAVRTFQARRSLNRARGDVLGEFRKELDAAKAADLKTKAELIESLKAEDAKKDEIEAELRSLLLRGIPQGRDWTLGEKAMAFLLNAMRWEFLPVKGSPMDRQDFPRFVEANIRFLDWIGTKFLFTEEQKAAYQAAKNEDKAERAEADAEELSDAEEMLLNADDKETEAPAEEPAAAEPVPEDEATATA